MTTREVQQQRKHFGIIGESVRFPGHKGEIIGGYLARPLGTGPYPGVVLIHEAFGQVTHTREEAHKFASAGFITICPDLYWREGMVVFDPADFRALMQLVGGLADAQAIGDLEGAASFLKANPACNGKLGAIGHCSGGRHTLLFACNTKSLSAAVDCYGGRVVPEQLTPAMPKAVIDMVGDLSCPLLGLFGEADRDPSPDHVKRLEDELKKHGKQYEVKSYAKPVDHGFFADYRPSYNQEAAVDGWERILTFFGKHLT